VINQEIGWREKREIKRWREQEYKLRRRKSRKINKM
jgi:hypothetical protein